MATRKPIKSRFAMMAIGLSFTVVGCTNTPNPNLALYQQPVVYAGLGIGGSHLEVDTTDKEFSQTESSSVAGQFTLGLAMAESWGFELRMADLGEAEFDDDRVLGYQIADVSAFGKLPVTPQTSVFARLGAGTLSNSGSDFTVNQRNSAHVVIGAGIDFDLSRHFSLRTEFSGHDVDARHAQLSLIYRFNPQGVTKPAVSVEPKPSVTERAVTAPATEAATVAESSATEAPVSEQVATAPTIETTPKPTISPKPEIAEPQTTPLPKPAAKVTRKQPSDSDNDGVIDTRDDCPGTSAAELVNTSGCALFGAVVPGVVFDVESASLNVESMTALDAIVASLKDNPEVRVSIGAYMSQSSDSASDLLLSRRRTIAVIRYLRAEGIDAARIQPNSNALVAESTNSSYENRIGIKRQ